MKNSFPLKALQEIQNDDPIASKVPFFYGWLMVFITVTATILSSPAQTYGISVFNPFLRLELNLSHSQISGAYMFGTLIASLPMSFVGIIVDRYGLRRSMTTVVIFFGIACVFMSQVTSLIALFFAFLMLRMTGQGALGLLTGNTVPMWFLRRLGRVTGAMNVVILAAISVIPAIFLWMNNTFSWRTSYLIFAAIIWIVMMPLMLIFFRNQPEDIGQVIDGSGQIGEIAAPTSEADGSDHGALNLKEATRTRAYWLLLALNVLWAMAVTAITFHLIPLFQNQGLSEGIAVGTFTTLALSAAAMQLLGGFLADRYRLNILLAISSLGFAVAMIFLGMMKTAWMGFVYAMIIGASQGILAVVGGTIWVRYYGRPHLGKIRGTAMTAIVLGSSIGPFLMGYTFDQAASYSPSLLFFLVCFVIMAVGMLFATPPRSPQLAD